MPRSRTWRPGGRPRGAVQGEDLIQRGPVRRDGSRVGAAGGRGSGPRMTGGGFGVNTPCNVSHSALPGHRHDSKWAGKLVPHKPEMVGSRPTMTYFRSRRFTATDRGSMPPEVRGSGPRMTGGGFGVNTPCNVGMVGAQGIRRPVHDLGSQLYRAGSARAFRRLLPQGVGPRPSPRMTQGRRRPFGCMGLGPRMTDGGCRFNTPCNVATWSGTTTTAVPALVRGTSPQ